MGSRKCVVNYIENNYSDIESDMNSRNSTAKRKVSNQKQEKNVKNYLFRLQKV